MEDSSENWAGIKRFYLKCAEECYETPTAEAKERLCEKAVKKLIDDHIATFYVVDDTLQFSLPVFIDHIADSMRGIERKEDGISFLKIKETI